MAKKPTQAAIDHFRLTHDPMYRNPGTATLPAGLKADAAYLGFLRGMGFDYATAQAVALKNITAARGQYATAVQRDPAQYEQERKTINDAALGPNDYWFSGQRLSELNKARVNDTNRLHDFATARAQGISDAETQLRQQISGLARGRAEQVGALQLRQSNVANQDKYIAAVRAAAQSSGGGGGGGGLTLTVPGGAGPVGKPGDVAGNVAGPPAPAFPVYHPGTSRQAYFGGLTQPQQMQFAAFLHGTTPQSKDPLSTLNTWLGAGVPRQGLPSLVSPSRGAF
jgi:hypothetical protein